LRQFGLHLFPLFTTALSELLRPAVPIAAGVFAAGLAAARRDPSGESDEESRRLFAKGAAAGLLLAGLGYSALVLSGTAATERATRMQFLSAPGIGLCLACVALLAASLFPAPRRVFVVAGLGVWVAAVGSGRLLALQEERGGWPSFPAQRNFLRQLTEQAPHLRANTLLVLLDDDATWPATFTFHHAVQYLYEGRASGFVSRTPELLYAARFVEDGVWFEPWPVVRKAWRAEPTFHRYGEVVVLRHSGGRLSIVERPASDPGGFVDRDAPLPAARRILR
jgi:hypothetical protein